MTTIFTSEVKCSVCGSLSAHPSVGSTNTFGGAPDLDTRPPEMMRSTIGSWVQRCPHCGYCARQLMQEAASADRTMNTIAYRQQLSATTFSELGNHFLCHALIREAERDAAAAGWAAIHAAWACDDVETSLHLWPQALPEGTQESPSAAGSAAIRCRRRAIELLERARSAGQQFASEAGAEEAILADLYRRIGQFDRVEALCDHGIAKIPEDLIRQVLGFERELAQRSDMACHTISEAAQSGGMAT